jgi:hypothetical protein
MSATIADFLDVLTKNKVLSIKIHTPLPVQRRLSLVSKELSNGQYKTASIGCAFLTL